MCPSAKKNWIVLIILLYYLLCFKSLTNARPEQTRPNSTYANLNVNHNVSSSERIQTSVRILSKPKTRRGDVPLKYEDEPSTNQAAIIFPDEEDFYESNSKFRKPSCAKGSTYCEKIEGYPSDFIERMLVVPSHLDDLFGVDDGPDEITNRLGDETDVSLCQSIEKTIFPKFGKTKDNEWKYIINQDDSDKYVQGIRVEICINPEQSCSLLSNETLGYTSYCKQKYTFRRLISLDENYKTTTDVFEVPSACCCTYKKVSTDSLSFRSK